MKAPVCKLCHVEHWGYQPHRWAQKQVVLAKGKPMEIKARVRSAETLRKMAKT
jgi:hypothetical protein